MSESGPPGDRHRSVYVGETPIRRASTAHVGLVEQAREAVCSAELVDVPDTNPHDDLQTDA